MIGLYMGLSGVAGSHNMETTSTNHHLVLASGSPRRRELLAMLGVSFDVVATNAEEAAAHDAVPAEVQAALPDCPLPLYTQPALLAWRKVSAALQSTTASVILGADTTVVLDGEVLNKPDTPEHACAMLYLMAGRTHTVYTGLCACSRHPDANVDTDTNEHTCRVPGTSGLFRFALVASNVTFAPLQTRDIEDYVATGEPMDKAGAYGIQGEGGKLVQAVAGSYTAVVGLPLPATWQLLTRAGMAHLTDPTRAYQSWLHAQGKEPMPCPPTLP